MAEQTDRHILDTFLLHVSVLMYHLQGEDHAIFLKTQVPCEVVVCVFFILYQRPCKHRYNCKGKGKVIPLQAQRVGRSITLLFQDRGT